MDETALLHSQGLDWSWPADWDEMQLEKLDGCLERRLPGYY